MYTKTRREEAEDCLMEYVIKCGEKHIGIFPTNGNPKVTEKLSVAEFVFRTLRDLHIVFERSAYNQILSEILIHEKEPKFSAQDFCLNHNSKEIREAALRFGFDKRDDIYNMTDCIYYVEVRWQIDYLREAIISENISRKDREIRNKNQSDEQLLSKMTDFSMLKEAQRELNNSICIMTPCAFENKHQ